MYRSSGSYGIGRRLDSVFMCIVQFVGIVYWTEAGGLGYSTRTNCAFYLATNFTPPSQLFVHDYETNIFLLSPAFVSQGFPHHLIAL